MEIWNGLTQQRQDLNTVKAVGHEDYLILVEKIQELQTFVLNLTNNVRIMPNLSSLLRESQEEIENLKALITKLSLPASIKDRLDQLEQLSREIDRRVDIAALKLDTDALKENLQKNQLEITNIQNSFATDVRGFQNKLLGIVEKLQNELEAKITSVREKLNQLETHIELQVAIEKLNQLQVKK